MCFRKTKLDKYKIIDQKKLEHRFPVNLLKNGTDLQFL